MKRILIVLIAVLLSNCGSDDVNENEVFENNTVKLKKTQLESVYKNEVSVLIEKLLIEAKTLDTKVEVFKNIPEINNLEAVQMQWKALQSVWKQLELYNIGSVADTFILFELNRWPINTEKIETHILRAEQIDESFIASKGSSEKGMASLEYLIYFQNAGETAFERLTSSESAASRIDYLTATVKNLLTNINRYEAAWNQYEKEFKTSTQTGITGSQNRLMNAMITLTEDIIVVKLGVPLGDKNSNKIDVNVVEAPYSKFSKEIITQHFKAIENLFYGNFTGNAADNLGFDDVLILNERADLVNSFDTVFVNINTKLTSIKGSLSEELITNKVAVQSLKDDFAVLKRLLSVDMASALNFTVTLNDNDGD